MNYDLTHLDHGARSRDAEGSVVRYIAVEGPIGVGKTTVANLLAERFRAQLILEQYEENPFLERFYRDRRGAAFQTQLFFLLSRYRQHQEMVSSNLFYDNIVCDYLFAKDRIFAEVNLSRDELKLYDEVATALHKTLPTPDVVIYLQGSVGLMQQNIKKRSRSFEQNIDREYLESLTAAYDDFFFHYRDSRLIVANCDSFDFLGRPDHFERLVETIVRSPYPPVEYMVPSDSFFSGGE